METMPWMDGVLAGVAIAVLLAGLWMLLNGVRGLGD